MVTTVPTIWKRLDAQTMAHALRHHYKSRGWVWDGGARHEREVVAALQQTQQRSLSANDRECFRKPPWGPLGAISEERVGGRAGGQGGRQGRG